MSFQLIFDVLWTLKGRKRRKSISKFGDWWPMGGVAAGQQKKKNVEIFFLKLLRPERVSLFKYSVETFI